MRNEIVARLVAAPTLLAPGSQAWVEATLNGAESAVLALGPERAERLRVTVDNDDDFWPDEDDWMSAYRPYRVQNGILVIPVQGVLINNFGFTVGSWMTGYDYISRAVSRGIADPEVRGIAFQVNSPGGEVSGCFDLVDEIYEARSLKPIRSFAADHAYSAGYAISSAANRIVVNRAGGVGSIGVVTWHADFSKMYEQAGIKMTPIFAGDHKIDGNPYQPLTDNVKAQIQARIDALYNIFVQTTARNRGMDEQAIRNTEALTYGAEDAVKIGLADAVGSFDESLAAFASELTPSTGGYAMSNNDTTAAAEAANEAALANARNEGTQAGATAERTRIRNIMECEEAKPRAAAALNIALNTSLSFEEAKSLLATLPEEKAESGTSAFEKAMNKSDNPGLGGGVLADDEGEKPSASATILADFRAATGLKAVNAKK